MEQNPFIFVVEGVSINEGGGKATLTVRLTEPISSEVTVDFATADGTAKAYSDYVPISGTLTFTPETTDQTVQVEIIDDNESEKNEKFSLDIFNSMGATIVGGSGLVIIKDDDKPLPPKNENIKFSIKGTFSESQGFLPNGSFKGWYLYPPSLADTNPYVNNVGVFEVPAFKINVYDHQLNLVDTLHNGNSNARIALGDFAPEIPGADEYTFSTTQDTEANPNGFFEFGSLELEYYWPYGGNPKTVPTQAPTKFKNGTFTSFAATESWESFNNPQEIESAEISVVDSPTSITIEAEDADTIVNYRTENISAASGGKVLSFLGGSQNEEGSATFGFNGAAGIYDLILGTFDENDGEAQFVVELNDVETSTTTQIASWVLDEDLGSNLANSQTAVSPTVSFGVSLTPGDTITVNGFEDANEHARLDFIQFEPTNPITIKAEDADTIVNYRRENISAASDGVALSFLGSTGNESGSATFVFGNEPNQLTGTYDIVVGTFEENDGLARFEVELNDFETGSTTEIGSLVLDQDLGSNLPNAQTFVSPTVATGVNLTAGDSITVHGFENANEHARLDFIRFEPVVI